MGYVQCQEDPVKKVTVRALVRRTTSSGKTVAFDITFRGNLATDLISEAQRRADKQWAKSVVLHAFIEC